MVVTAKLRSSLLSWPEHLNAYGTQQKKNQPQQYLNTYWSIGPDEGPQPIPALSAPLSGGVPAMVSWSGPVSLRKGLAGGLDGTAPPAVSSIPIHLTSSVEDTL